MLYFDVLFWWAEANRPNSNVMFEGQSSQNTENRSNHSSFDVILFAFLDLNCLILILRTELILFRNRLST